MFDKAFLHGRIYTMKERGACVEAMLVHDGKILAVGTDEEIDALIAALKEYISVSC